MEMTARIVGESSVRRLNIEEFTVVQDETAEIWIQNSYVQKYKGLRFCMSAFIESGRAAVQEIVQESGRNT